MTMRRYDFLIWDQRARGPKTFGEGRRCAHRGCITRLSRYHEGQFCYLHQGEIAVKREAEESGHGQPRTCRKCGKTYPQTPQHWLYEQREHGLRVSHTCKSCKQAMRRERQQRKRLERKRTEM